MATKSSSHAKGRAHAARTQRRRAAQHRRQELARRRSPGGAAPAKRSRRWWYAGLAGLVVVALAAGGIFALRDGGKPTYRLRAPIVSHDSGDRAITDNPSTYRVVYHFQSFPASGDAVSYTQEVTVRRPFDGRSLYKEGLPPGTKTALEVVSNLGVNSQFSAGDRSATAQPARPDLAVADQRIGVALPQLVELGVYEPRERREVLGRECVVYHTGRPFEGRSLAKATPTTYADVCIDRAGIVLEEVSVRDKALATRVEAIELTVDQAIEDSFTVPPLPPSAVGADQLIEADKTKAPTNFAVSKFWSLASPPAGYEHRGRWRYLKSNDDPNAPPGAPPVPPSETYYDIYVSSIDVVIVQQGTAGTEPAVDKEITKPITIEGFNEGQIEASFNGLTVILHTTDDGYVRISGTVSAEQLASIAATLRSV